MFCFALTHMLRRLFHDESRLSVGGIAHIQELSTPDFGTVPAFGNIGLLSVSNNLPFAPFHSVPLFFAPSGQVWVKS
jgi:hypothetical protein